MFHSLVASVLQAASPSPSSTTATGEDYGSTRDFLDRMLSEASPQPGPFLAFAGPAGRLLGVALFVGLVAAVLGLAFFVVAMIVNIRKGNKVTGYLLGAFGCALAVVVLGSFGVFTLGWFDLIS